MSKEMLNVVQETWRKSRGNGVALGKIFRLNLQKLNPNLSPIKSKTTQHLLDLLLLQAIDEVINCLDDQQELVFALRNFCSLFALSNDKRNEIKNIGEAIFLTIEQVMDEYFSSQLQEARRLLSRILGELELTAERSSK